MNFGTIQVADIFVGALNAIEAYFGTEKVWEKSAPPPTANWLCFTAEEANSTVAMAKGGWQSPPAVSLECSTDGNTWSPFEVGTTTVTLANIGDYVYVRATSAGNTGMGTSSISYNKFVMTGKIAASGNVDTLLDQNGNATLTSYCFNGLFSGCSSLTTAPALPATTLANNCYADMFFRCASLTTAPELPATTLADNCYKNMFKNCSSLTSAPELPATTIAIACYSNMFSGCSSLTTAPALPATIIFSNCYEYMFYGCSSLTTAPATLPATTLYIGCYASMFQNCTSLTSAPTLPSTTLYNNCYQLMFSGCSNLNSITLGYTGNFADAPNNAFSNWVSGVASTGTFYYNGSDTTTGNNAIPTGWTITPFTP